MPENARICRSSLPWSRVPRVLEKQPWLAEQQKVLGGGGSTSGRGLEKLASRDQWGRRLCTYRVTLTGCSGTSTSESNRLPELFLLSTPDATQTLYRKRLPRSARTSINKNTSIPCERQNQKRNSPKLATAFRECHDSPEDYGLVQMRNVKTM